MSFVRLMLIFLVLSVCRPRHALYRLSGQKPWLRGQKDRVFPFLWLWIAPGKTLRSLLTMFTPTCSNCTGMRPLPLLRMCDGKFRVKSSRPCPLLLRKMFLPWQSSRTARIICCLMPSLRRGQS